MGLNVAVVFGIRKRDLRIVTVSKMIAIFYDLG